ncbi:hypothetical protein EDEG_03354 [Edhazardia aedis USNM 41457]|uniref:Uncharacterized protein n=1 Tax=Edhazardia aedis (strain USNM 41457) TaxID=1003232 RepID=J9DHV6_EDHAE|nr:hypothetical protein EDEG_03354 [Edhazardia aedis USNM 41457]|eukprot:EJW02200.1 hypothetical protein EDEG_03354 [Edhazardia aedis USNM 41457]
MININILSNAVRNSPKNLIIIFLGVLMMVYLFLKLSLNNLYVNRNSGELKDLAKKGLRIGVQIKRNNSSAIIGESESHAKDGSEFDASNIAYSSYSNTNKPENYSDGFDLHPENPIEMKTTPIDDSSKEKKINNTNKTISICEGKSQECIHRQILFKRVDILQKYDVNELFDILNDSKNCNEEFHWKGLLFAQIHDFVGLKYQETDFLNYINVKFHSNLVEFVMQFYEFYVYSEILTYENCYSKKYNIDEIDCCKNIIVSVDESNISQCSDFYDENGIFIRKFNTLFKLIWINYFNQVNRKIWISNLSENWKSPVFNLTDSSNDYSDAIFRKNKIL